MVARAIDKLNAVYAKGIRTIVDPTVWGLGRVHPADPADRGGNAHQHRRRHRPVRLRGTAAAVRLPRPRPGSSTSPSRWSPTSPGTSPRASAAPASRPPSSSSPWRPPSPAPASSASAGPSPGPTSRPARPSPCTPRARTRPAGSRCASSGEEGVDLSKVMIGHAGDSNDLDYLTELADAGVLLGMDRFGLDLFNPTAERVKTIAALASRGYAASMVLAHDANCFIDYFGAAHDASPRRRRAELALRAHHRRRAARPAGGGRHPGADRHDDGGEPGALLHAGQGPVTTGGAS